MTMRAPFPPRLPDAAWRQADGLVRLCAALGADGGQVRYVGGAVRDTLAGLPVTDVDLATDRTPDDAAARAAAAGLKVVPTGIAHGTLTVVADHRPYEVTTYRRDVATDGRRATVAFASDWRDDAARRDFTINALYADPVTGVIDDAHGGLGDLARRRVRFIGEAATRIAEDHLRILRFYRFVARFQHGPPEPADRAACVAARATLRALSRERVAMELLRLLALPDPAPATAMMHDDGIIAEVLPEVDADGPVRVAALVAAERAHGASPDPLRRLIALLPADAGIAGSVASRLRLSNAQSRHIARVRDKAVVESDPHALAYRVGLSAATDRLLLAGRSPATLDGWTVPRLPVSGGDLIAAGVPRGPDVARALRAIEAAWIDAGFPADRAATLALLEASGP